MQFIKLRMAGFKSFVDAIELDIEPGVTGVVGPNGCGKSNLVEAIKWVMGETSAKQIRGHEMDDVIFSGTINRPSRNIAEVGLEMDNSDKTAPTQFNEYSNIEITRRIVREKGSTYKINSQEVRARDVHLLFADQASGARSTALVSQGQISEVILAKPSDRRKLLEEAAGITGLHSRRHEAELRLRGAETNLERLDDILGSLDTQKQGLRKQARQASRYRNLKDHIRRAQATFMFIRWNSVSHELTNASSSLKSCENTVAEITTKAAAATTEQAEAASYLPLKREEEAAATAALQNLILAQTNLQEEEARVETIRQETETRLSQTSQDIEREKKLISDCSEAIATLKDEHQKASGDSEDYSESIDEALRNLKAAQDSFKLLDIQSASAIKLLAAEEEQRKNLLEQSSEIESRLSRLQKEKEVLAGQVGELENKTGNQQPLFEANFKLETAESNVQKLRSLLLTADADRLEKVEDLEKYRVKAQESMALASRLEAKERALSELLEIGDADLWPPLVDSLTVEPGYETALGSALGDDLSAPNNEAAPVHWANLPNYDNTALLPSDVKPLSDYVSGSNVLVRRLSQIGVVKDTETGRKLATKLLQGQRLVALDGGFWRWDGYTATSDAPAAAAVRLEQRNQLEEIRQQLASAKSNSLLDEQTVAKAKNEADTSTREESEARKALWNAEKEISELQKIQSENEKKISEVNTLLSVQREALIRVTNDIKEAESQVEEIFAKLSSLPNIANLEKEAESLQNQATEARNLLADSQSKHDNLQLQSKEKQERIQKLTDELFGWQERQLTSESQMQQLLKRYEDLIKTKTKVSNQPDEIELKRASLLEKIDMAETLRKDATDQLIVSEERLAAADSNLKSAQSQLANVREERVRAEATTDQVKQSIEALIERIKDILNCDPNELGMIASITDDTPLPELEAAEKRVERLERERENMGPVNLRAEVEVDELQEKIETLNNEREDLLKAIETLRRGINKLNREGRQRLVASFSEVNKHFGELFSRLFGGGKAHLELVDSDDPLDAGIEIMASPPGKKLQALSLLSGGEQALTALALLFGVFLTNPAPICVLDEVDAPLDDNNVDHFCTLIEEMAHTLSTRFIVVTHHRMTMARMDRLYGVTMGERGVSQLVSVDLGQAVELREIA